MLFQPLDPSVRLSSSVFTFYSFYSLTSISRSRGDSLSRFKPIGRWYKRPYQTLPPILRGRSICDKAARRPTWILAQSNKFADFLVPLNSGDPPLFGSTSTAHQLKSLDYSAVPLRLPLVLEPLFFISVQVTPACSFQCGTIQNVMSNSIV